MIEKFTHQATVQHEDALNETARKLAVVTRIKSISPIEGADRIVAVSFRDNGWVCVAGKDEYRVGDLCVFFEIDSFLKKDERYDTILSKCLKTMDGQEGYRLKSAKFRGQISQGFSMPLSKFPEIDPNTPDGTDVTKDLGVRLWVSPVASGFQMGNAAGDFPSHLVPKTDQERIQSLKRREIMGMFGTTFEISEKCNGTSATFIMHRKEIPTYGCYVNSMTHEVSGSEPHVEYDFYACSRNLQIKPPEEDNASSIYWNMVKNYLIQQRLQQWCEANKRSIAIQGEICGQGVQKNPLGLPSVHFFVFDIYDVDVQRYLTASDRHQIVKELNKISPDISPIEHVPVLGYKKLVPLGRSIRNAYEKLGKVIGENFESVDYVDWERDDTLWDIFLEYVVEDFVEDLVKQADGDTFTGKPNREGVVYKSTVDGSKSFKAISNKYLLSEKD